MCAWAPLLWACSGTDDVPTQEPTAADTGTVADDTAPPPDDVDGDGWSEADGDCNDADADVHPTAHDPCDGLDADCDGDLELDGDSDDFRHCEECDDGDATTFPGAPDPLDGVDSNCDRTDGVGLPSNASVAGSVACGELGWSVATLDMDGDGTDEVAAGAPRYGICGPGTVDKVVLASPARMEAEFVGSEAGELLGWQVDAFSHGGTTLLAITRPFVPPGNAVEIYEIDGGFASSPRLRVEGTATRDLGDIEAVGIPTTWLAVSTLAGYGNPTSVLLFPPDASGQPALADATQQISSTNQHFASGLLEGVGDRDGDGLHELAVSAERGDGVDPVGRAYVVTPGVDATLEANEIWLGQDPNDSTGSARTGGDLDGDGRAEVAISSHHADDDRGRVHVVPWLGPGTHLVFDEHLVEVMGELPDDYLQATLIADADGDGTGDLVVGAQQNRGDPFARGKAMLFLGPLAGTLTRAEADKVWVGPEPGARFGWAFTSGDFDGNGVLDLAVGTPDEDSADGVDVGAVHFLFDYGI